jgi:hypothetical protein
MLLPQIGWDSKLLQLCTSTNDQGETNVFKVNANVAVSLFFCGTVKMSDGEFDEVASKVQSKEDKKRFESGKYTNFAQTLSFCALFKVVKFFIRFLTKS